MGDVNRILLGRDGMALGCVLGEEREKKENTMGFLVFCEFTIRFLYEILPDLNKNLWDLYGVTDSPERYF